MESLSFEPLIPAALWVTMAVAAVVLLVVYAVRRPATVTQGRWTAIVVLMGMCVAAVLAVLLNPTWVREITPPTGRPLVRVLVDATASMKTADAGGGKTRFQAAGALAQALSSGLGDTYDVKVDTFSDGLKSADAAALGGQTPTGQTTDLAAALGAAMEVQNPQGQVVVLVSDGIDNAAGGTTGVLAAAHLAKAMGVPVDTRTLGGAVEGFDLGIEPRWPQELAFVGQRVPIIALVSHPGLGGGRAKVSLWRNGRQLQEAEVDLASGPLAEAHFAVTQETSGLYDYELRVEPRAGELTEANNIAAFQVRVVDEPIRVLLLEGKPYWDSKFLTRTLAADPSVQLESVVKLTPSRLLWRKIPRDATMRQTATKPTATQPMEKEEWTILDRAAGVLGGKTDLRKYQIIVLGREAEDFLTEEAVARLQKWVARDGGALVCYRGAPVAEADGRLAKLLPVKWSPVRQSKFRMQLTEQGQDLHWLGQDGSVGASMARLPELATASEVQRSKPLAVVLATASGSAGVGPAVTYQPYGSGRVVVVEGAGMWRWAFLPPEEQSSQEAYGSLWHGLLRWLVSGTGLLPGQKLALRADRISFDTGESATATLLLRSEAQQRAPPAVELTGQGVARTLTPLASGDDPGAWRVEFGKLSPGRYAAQVAGATTEPAGRIIFDVRAFGQEELDLKARPDLMARIAAESGGAVLQEATAQEMGKMFEAQIRAGRPVWVERSSAWDRWWVLACILGLWTVTWAVRRGSGLV